MADQTSTVCDSEWSFPY